MSEHDGSDPLMATRMPTVLQHEMWGRTDPLPSTILAKLQNERSTLDASARLYNFDIVL